MYSVIGLPHILLLTACSAVKLEYSGFSVENLLAVRSTYPVVFLMYTESLQDCMELLLPMAAKKLDLSFNIESNVPPCELCCADSHIALLTIMM